MAGAGLVVAPSPPAAAEDELAYISEIHYAGGNDADFVELEGSEGSDVSGWTVGSITRGDSPQSAAHVVVLPEGAVISGSGAIAVDVPITNSTTGGYGSSIFAVDPDGVLAGFWTIGYRPDANGGSDGGSVAGTSALLPPSVRGQAASPTHVLGSASQSLQLIDGEWTAAAPTKGVGNGSGGPVEPGEPGEDTHGIAEVQGEGASSPLAGQAVTVSGVVTAIYPTGGFDGYYIQTPGSGGDADLSERTASDAVFVYSPATVDSVEIDDYIQVTGEVTEHFGLTQIVVGAEGLAVYTEPAETVKPVPFELPRSEERREVFEGMLVAPAQGYTVSDTYALGGWGTNAFGSIGLGFGGPLMQETDVARPGTPEYDDVADDNRARSVTLDDGQSVRTSPSHEVPYLTASTPVRTGAGLTFVDDVIFDYRFQWNFQPRRPVTGEASDVVLFDGGNTREANQTPEDVGGDVTIASFNVLNYFTTLGADLEGCTAYTDRDGNPLTVRGGCLARGAWDEVNLQRQEAKIVAAIGTLDADVVALQEIENSAVFGKDPDTALADLVDALNEAEPDTWAYVETPDRMPQLADQDVIRNAFIYRPSAVQPVDEAVVLVDHPAYGNAREPLAQEFTVTETGYSFIGIVNHFKSKGGDCAPEPPEGCFNEDRVAQAEALVQFADTLSADTGTEDVFLIGDFNAYSQEDPIQVFLEAGYTDLVPAFDAGYTYVFDGKVGSLDHILAGPSVTDADLVRDVDVWSINSVESVLVEYSRFNYFASELFEPGTVWRASDHDPIIVGVGPVAQCPDPDMRETVVIRGRDSGVENRSVGGGCTVNDAIDDERDWPSKGALVRHVGDVTDKLVEEGVIDARERSRIIQAAARSER
nr:ExeM/NucH family extracellular endonuclease [Phytoactinopolyspora alkaliphila]